jgi:hypothetical protein
MSRRISGFFGDKQLARARLKGKKYEILYLEQNLSNGTFIDSFLLDIFAIFSLSSRDN